MPKLANTVMRFNKLYIKAQVKIRRAIQRLTGKNQASAVQRTVRTLSFE